MLWCPLCCIVAHSLIDHTFSWYGHLPSPTFLLGIATTKVFKTTISAPLHTIFLLCNQPSFSLFHYLLRRILTSDHCVCCKMAPKRLATHFPQEDDAVCTTHYMAPPHNKFSTAKCCTILPGNVHVNTSHELWGATLSHLNLRSSLSCGSQ